MKKLYFKNVLLSAFILAVLTLQIRAQEITLPEYSYGEINAQYGTVTPDGVTNPGPYGGSAIGKNESPFGISFAHGYRWWGYSGYPILICGDLPVFDFPGYHGVWDMSNIGCVNPPIGYMGSWGGVSVDLDKQEIRCLVGARNVGGPTAQYCVPFMFSEICYPPPSTWGYGTSFGYSRKVFVVQSTGLLHEGESVEIKASLSTQGVLEGEGDLSARGILFLNKLSVAQWLQWGNEILTWGGIEDILGTSEYMGNMLGHLNLSLNAANNFTAYVVVGDTVVIEAAFKNEVKHSNNGASGDAEGWAGSEPDELYNINYVRTDSVRNLISKYANVLTYNLISLTPGAVLEPLGEDGPMLDGDQDGTSDTQEKGPDGNDDNFDGNDDGTADHEQPHVASFHTYDGQTYVTLVVPEGVDLAELKVTANPSPDDAPQDIDFPYGFFDFTIDGLDEGEAIQIIIILHSGVTVSKYYKYGMTPDNTTPHWYEFMYDGQTGAVINGNEITLHFVDGLRGDEDITVNGTIKEPGGPSSDSSTGYNDFLAQDEFVLDQNLPNPFVTETTIRFNLGVPAKVVIRIFNVWGQEIDVLLNEEKQAGEYFIHWDGLNNAGMRCTPGIYYYRMDVITENESYRGMKKMILMQ